MDITFSEQNGVYVGEVEITDVCALHIVRKSGGDFSMYQSHVNDGEYDTTEGIYKKAYSKTIDTVIDEKIFPLYLRLVSETEVLNAQTIY